MRTNKITNVFVAAIISFIVVGSFAACNKNDDVNYKQFYDSVLNMPPGALKATYDGKDISFTGKAEDFQTVYTSGVVISNASAGNLPDGYILIQDEDEGLAVKLEDAENNTNYSVGDEIKIYINDAKLTKENGNVILTGVSSDDIEVESTGNTLEPTTLTLKVLSNNFDKYNESLIKVAVVRLDPEPASGTKYGGVQSMTDGSINSGIVNLFTFPNADLTNKEVADTATYTALVMYNKTDNGDSLAMQLWLRDEDDIEAVNLIQANSPIIITGFMPDPPGVDEPAPGYVSYPTGVNIIHEAGYEYIQFMALEDIDFSQHPFSVVTCTNRTVLPDGWATGELNTYKFDLTDGVAKAGTFFYVGAAGKVINGYGSNGLSTDISDANWIRAIVINDGSADASTPNVTGDGFGYAVESGFLQNVNGGGGSSDGMAIFEGTTVTKNSVPLDAIFYNPPMGNAYVAPDIGYQVPDNEFYSREDNGDAQHLFGQGTNTYIIPKPASSLKGLFCTMGGVVSSNGWLAVRDPQWKSLTEDSQLSDIEEGVGITVFK